MVPSLRAVPHLSSHGSCKPTDDGNLSAREGHVVEVLGQGSPLPMGSLALMPPTGSPPLNLGPHSQSWQW